MSGARPAGGRGLTVLAIWVLVGLAGSASGQQPNPDVWAPVRFMVGEWEGRAAGEAGTGTVRRSYAFVLKDRYLHEKNLSTYPPQVANKAGEVHEHWNDEFVETFELAAPGKDLKVYSRNELTRVKR